MLLASSSAFRSQYLSSMRPTTTSKINFLWLQLGGVPAAGVGMDLERLSSSNLLEFNNKSVEETIIEVSKWALLAIRIPGYLPLTTIRSNFGLQFELVRCSAATFYTLFIGFFAILGNCFFAHTFIDKFFLAEKAGPPDDKYGNTEVFVWVSLLCLVCYTTYLRITRIFYGTSSLKYWKATVRLIESFVGLDYHLNSARLRGIYSSSRNWTLFYLFIAFARMAYGIYNLYDSILTRFDTLTDSEVKALCLDLFLALTLCLHVGYSIWLTFLVKLLVFCFETIHEDLKLSQDSTRGHKIRPSGASGTAGWFGRRKSIPFHHPMSYDVNSGPDDSAFCIGGSATDVSTATVEGLLGMEARLRKTIHAYEAIEDQMHEFNKLFGTSIVLETAFAFMLLIVNVYAGESYWEPDRATVVYVLFTMGVPIVIYATSLFHFASECSLLSGKATATLKKLQQFFVPMQTPSYGTEFQLQLKLVGFISRVADNPPSISASHFFTVNRRLLTSVLGTVTTYLVVLLQFREKAPAGSPTTANAGPGNETDGSGPFSCPGNASWACQCRDMDILL